MDSPEGFGEPQGGAPIDSKVSFEAVRDLVRSDRRGALVTVVAGPELGAKLLIGPGGTEGTLGDPALDEQALALARELIPGEESAVREVAGRELFYDVFAPQPRLLIVGAVDFAAALARFASLAGFRVTVVDARERFATRERIPDADRVVVAWPQELITAEPPDDATYAAVLTHEPRFDDPTLQALLQSDVAYIGAMGSRRAHAERIERLREAGFGDQDIARISGPIGLDIGAKTPEETAVSILAEVIAARHGRSGGRLSERGQPVHSLRERGSLEQP
jgi:xanthine dehydrogenase accessory factor